MSSERRKHPRLAASTRVLWHPVGEATLQYDRLTDVSKSGCLIATETVPAFGCEVYFELVGEDGDRIADGLGRVVWVDSKRGVGVQFLDIELAAETIALRSQPPPLPVKPLRPAESVRPSRTAYSRVGVPKLDSLAPLLEPLAVPNDNVIGIDLGTTNTCVAYVVKGRPYIIPGRGGGSTIPSMISIDDDGATVVGELARRRQVLNPGRTVYGSKRLLGRTFRSALSSAYQQHFAFPLVKAEGQRFGMRLDDNRVVSMDEVAVAILDEVRAHTSLRLLRPIEAAVIAVPAYFSEVQRDAVRRAAQSAGLDAHRLVTEPTAAAVAYGHNREIDATIAVWDFGGGTFDFTVVRVSPGYFEVLATGGDGYLGGSDFDDALAAHFLTQCQKAFGDGFRPYRQQIARLRQSAELAKRALSAQTQFSVELPAFESGKVFRGSVTRKTFARLTQGLVDRCVEVAIEVLTQRGMSPSDVDDVLLVGGSTRIPAVQDSVEQVFGRRPSRRLNPDEAVALGAAILASQLSDETAPRLLDVLPMSVSTALPGGAKHTLVNRNLRVPLQQETTVQADASGRAELPLFQGDDRDLRVNEYLCTAVAEGFDPQLGGGVIFRIRFDENCAMSVVGRTENKGRVLPVRLDRRKAVDEVLSDLGLLEMDASEAWPLPRTGLEHTLLSLFGGTPKAS